MISQEKPHIVSFNASLIPRHQVSISPDDRGFRYGDGVFETIAIVSGLPYLWSEHMARLQQGLHVLGIDADIDYLTEHLVRLIAMNDVRDGMARVMVTRGCGSQGYLPTYESTPTILLEAFSTISLLAIAHEPMALWCSKWRRFPPSSLPTDAKIMQGLNATLARIEATKHGGDEALMLAVDGSICEAASGNVFWMLGNMLCTPALNTGCLAGVMRQRLIALWAEEVMEVNISLNAMASLGVDAMVMTNALRGAVPIHSIINDTMMLPESIALAKRCNHLIAIDIIADGRSFLTESRCREL